MSDKEKAQLKENIKAAMKISSQKLRETKRALGQTLVISEGGKIKLVNP